MSPATRSSSFTATVPRGPAREERVALDTVCSAARKNVSACEAIARCLAVIDLRPAVRSAPAPSTSLQERALNERISDAMRLGTSGASCGMAEAASSSARIDCAAASAERTRWYRTPPTSTNLASPPLLAPLLPLRGPPPLGASPARESAPHSSLASPPSPLPSPPLVLTPSAEEPTSDAAMPPSSTGVATATHVSASSSAASLLSALAASVSSHVAHWLCTVPRSE
mmetsp:Transcript_2514/g.10011  ORF Transcript_2514/g.10011 Transcript_2514/m.10011 type:complete len:227 (+) Transcript_2514:521-1201(+)